MNNFPHVQFTILSFLFVCTLFAGKISFSKDSGAHWKPLILDFTPNDVQQIAFSSPNEEFILEKQEASWNITTPTTAIADKTLVQRVLTILEEVDCISDTSNPINEYGLNDPYLVITLNGDAQKAISIGDKTPFHDGNYILYNGKTCRSKTEISSRIPNTAKEYLSKQLVHITPFKIHSVIHTDQSIFSKTDVGWMQIHPFRTAIDNEKFDEWLTKLTETTWVEIHDAQEQSPEKTLTITLKHSDKEERIRCTELDCTINNGLSGTISPEALHLFEIPPSWFFETAFLSQIHRNHDVIALEIQQENHAPFLVYPEENKSVFENITKRPVYRKTEAFVSTPNTLKIHLSNDTQIQYSFRTTEDGLLFQNAEEDTVIVAPLDFLPLSE